MDAEKRNLEIGKSFARLVNLFLILGGFLLIGSWTLYEELNRTPDILKIFSHILWLYTGIASISFAFTFWIISHFYIIEILPKYGNEIKNKIKNWIISIIKEIPKIIFKTIIPGLIVMIIFGFYFASEIDSYLNPTPKIKESCYFKNENMRFILTNPSKSPAENFNMIIKEEYGGEAGMSFVDSELCTVGNYNTEKRYTLIHCDYIPPKSFASISVKFKDKTQKEFNYSSWGNTTPKKNDTISCKE